MLGLALDAQHARTKLRHRREKGQPCNCSISYWLNWKIFLLLISFFYIAFSETDSECSSVEDEMGRGLRRGGGSSSGSGSTQRSKTHHKPYRKRYIKDSYKKKP